MHGDLKELIEATSMRLGISEPVIEKDYFVTKAIHTLTKAKNEYFELVFQGGTCLSKAHKIIQHMSEDCDFRIIVNALGFYPKWTKAA